MAGTPEKGSDFARQLYTLFGDRVVECTGQPQTGVEKSLRKYFGKRGEPFVMFAWTG